MAELEIDFGAEVFYWRGPAPFYFVAVPDQWCRQIQELSGEVSYGWGMIPAVVTMGDTTWPTALWPRNGGYVVPLKAWVRKAEGGIDDGDHIEISLEIGVEDGSDLPG